MFAAATRPWYLPMYVSGHTPVTSPIAQRPSATRIRSSTGMPWRVGSTPTVSRPMSVDARAPAGGHEQAVAAQLLAPGELDDVLVALAAHGGGLLAEVELDPVGLERGAQRVAERLRLARQHVVHALHERDRRAEAPDGLRHLHSHRAAAQHEHAGAAPRSAPVTSRLVHTPSSSRRPGMGGITGSEPVAITTWSAEYVSSPTSTLPGPASRRGTAEQLDALLLEVCRVGRVVVARDHEIAPREGGLRADAAAHGLARAGRVARRLERLAGPQQRLRGDARPVVALAAHALALDDGHAQAAVGEAARRSAAPLGRRR